MDLITSRENIQLAYRNLKKNDGSYTAGVDGKNIEYLQTWEMDKLIFHIQRKFNNYSPQPVRRVEIPKPNGKNKTTRNTHNNGQNDTTMHIAGIRANM